MEPTTVEKPAATTVDPATAAAVTLDPKRVEALEQVNQDLVRQMGELKSTITKTEETKQPGQTWDKLSDDQLEYVSTHPLEYPQHATAALQEIRRRDKAAIRSEILAEVGQGQIMEQNKEAFDPNTPIGKEVSKILARNRNQKDILSDVIELAQHRIEGTSGKEKGRKETVDALRAATAHAPGAEAATVIPPPSFLEMPKDQFEKEVEKVKMKGFK